MSTANIANTKIVPSETTLRPFYDDFNEDKNFHRILFRPGYAVQARELTQLQTILQNQIERFGNHVFRNGSLVLDGQISLDDTAIYINLASTYAGVDVDTTYFKSNTITYGSGNAKVRAVVLDARDATSTEPPTLIIKYLTGDEFSVTSNVKTSDNVYATVAPTTHTGAATVASINDGIFFINGYFVKVPAQTIVVDKYSSQANAKVGLEFSNDIITEQTDTTLLDPAQEASNYQAPGAARLKINFDLAVRSLSSEDDEQFVEILRVENGVIKKRIDYATYSALGKTLADRTFDESGNYTVKRFKLNVNEHPTDNTKIQVTLDPGKAYIHGYPYENIAQEVLDVDKARDTVDATNQDITFNFGNSLYIDTVRGYFNTYSMERVDIHSVPYQYVKFDSATSYAQTKIGTARTREMKFQSATTPANANTFVYALSIFDTQFSNLTSNVVNASANGITLFDPTSKFSANNDAYVGATLRITSGSGLGEKVTITSYVGSTKQLNTATAFVTTPTNASNVAIDFNMKPAESLVKHTTYTSGDVNANANINLLSKADGVGSGDTFVTDITFNRLVYPFAEEFIKAASIANAGYSYMAVSQVTFTANAATITLSAGETFDGTDDTTGISVVNLGNFMAFRASGERLNLSNIDVDNGVPSVVLTNSDNYNSTAYVYHRVSINSGSKIVQKKKVLVSANTTNYIGDGTLAATVTQSTSAGVTTSSIYLVDGQVVISNPPNVPGEKISLYVSDVKTIQKIYDLNGAALPAADADLTGYTDVTSKYFFDNGQRDSHYDHAAISLNPRNSKVTGPIVVCFDYYDHQTDSGGENPMRGFFSVDSYPNAATTGYGDIPIYTAGDGTVLALRDCIDFRPRRQNASNTTPGYTMQGVRIPISGTSFESDYSNYHSRRDLVVLTTDFERPFKIIEGAPTTNPVEPRAPDNSMVLYKLYIEPYTLSTANVGVTYVENRRYTMRDIGKLETRIENLEYYQTLSQLEKQTSELSILDANGLERTKYGILADDFSTHGYGDVNNPDYLISIDRVNGGLYPSQNTVAMPLYDAANTDSKTLGPITTIKFTEEDFIVQDAATKYVSVQPYMTSQWVGSMEMNPPDDVWVETRKAPDVIVNLGENDALVVANTIVNTLTRTSRAERIRRANAFATENNWWLRNFGTGSAFFTTLGGRRLRRRTRPQGTIITNVESGRFDAGITDISIIPYMRDQLVQFTADGMRPSRRVYFFFDDTDVTDYIIKTDELLLTENSENVIVNSGFSNTDIITVSANVATVVQAGRFFDFDNATPSLQDDARPRRRRRILRLARASGRFAASQGFVGSVSGNTGTVGAITVNGGETLENFFENGSSNTITLPLRTRDVANNYWGTNGANTIILMPRRRRAGRRVRAYITGFNNVTQVLSLSNTLSVLTTDNPDSDLPTDNTDNEISWTIGDAHYTDAEGKIAGTFSVPAGLFRTGERIFRIIDSVSNDSASCTTRADYRFVSSGIQQTKNDIVVNTPRVTVLPPPPTTPRRPVRRIDPIAQTFFVEDADHPNGVFISSLDLYFRNKDEALPVTVQIRPTVNGYPHSYEILPNAETVVPSEFITTSEDGSVSTRVNFGTPVYLPPGEYALTIISDSKEYEVFVSELGAKIIGSNRIVSEQPYLGSLFKSQNASTWDAIQLEDLTFKLNKCVFNTATTATVYLYNYVPGSNAYADLLYTHIDDVKLPNTNIVYAHSYDSGSTYESFVPDSNYIPGARTTFVPTSNGIYRLRATLTTSDRDISPILYNKTGLVLAVENLIDNANIDSDDLTVSTAGYYAANGNTSINLTIRDYRGSTIASGTANVNATGNIANVIITSGGYGFINTANIMTVADRASTANATVVVASELDASGGPALSKYISRRVTLAEGFEAGDLRVFVTAYKPIGTDVKVYYKVKNPTDADTFDSKGYTLMNQKTKSTVYSALDNYDNVIEYEFEPYDAINAISYSTQSTTYTSFNQFAVKLVLLSEDTIKYPIAYDMRAIALPAMDT